MLDDKFHQEITKLIIDKAGDGYDANGGHGFIFIAINSNGVSISVGGDEMLQLAMAKIANITVSNNFQNRMTANFKKIDDSNPVKKPTKKVKVH